LTCWLPISVGKTRYSYTETHRYQCRVYKVGRKEGRKNVSGKEISDGRSKSNNKEERTHKEAQKGEIRNERSK
jgi:hypothetical protein